MDAKTQLSKLGIELDTNNFEAKLRAIAKHAEALANELESLDEDKCLKCGSSLEIDEIYQHGEVMKVLKNCKNCGDRFIS